MRWTVSLPRAVAEDDKVSHVVEADTIEEAIIAACHHGIHGKTMGSPIIGQVYNVFARVEVRPRPTLPLKSV